MGEFQSISRSPQKQTSDSVPLQNLNSSSQSSDVAFKQPSMKGMSNLPSFRAAYERRVAAENSEPAAHADVEKGDGQQGDASLINTIQTLLEEDPVNYERLIEAIHAASLEQRQAARHNEGLRDLINNSSLSDGEATTVMSSLLEGSQTWQNPFELKEDETTRAWVEGENGLELHVTRETKLKVNDFYAYFIRGHGNPPTDTSTMNCWDSILYAAYLANLIDENYIRNFYEIALRSGLGPQADVIIWQQLGWSEDLDEYPRQASGTAQNSQEVITPTAGQLVFYLPEGAAYPSHIAISLGEDRAISLWNQPNNVDAVQRININELPGAIYIGNSPW